MDKKSRAPNPALVKLDNGIFKMMQIISWVSAVCLLIITVLSTADVFASKVLKHGITNATDLVTYLNIPVVFLSAAYVQLERGHTHIDLIYTHFPMPVQKIIHTVGNLLGLVISAFIGYRAVILTISKFKTVAKSSSAASAFVVWPFVAIISLGFFILAAAFLWSLFREFLLPPREMPAPEGAEGPAPDPNLEKGESGQ